MTNILRPALAIFLISCIALAACNSSSEQPTSNSEQKKSSLNTTPELPINSEALNLSIYYDQEFPSVLSSDIDNYGILMNFLKNESGDSCQIAIPVYSSEDELSLFKGIDNNVEYIDIELPLKESYEELNEMAYVTLAVSGNNDICVRVYRNIEEENVLFKSRHQIIEPENLPDFDSLKISPDSASLSQSVASAFISSFFYDDNTIFFISEKAYNEDLNEITITYLTQEEAELEEVTYDTTSQYLAFQIIAATSNSKAEQTYWTTIKLHIPQQVSEKKKKKVVNTKQSDVKKQKTIMISRKI